jgi:hypothetical protein
MPKFKKGDKVVISRELRRIDLSLGARARVERHSEMDDKRVWIRLNGDTRRVIRVHENEIEHEAEADNPTDVPATCVSAGRCPFVNGYVVTVKVEGCGDALLTFFCPPSYVTGEYATRYLYVKPVDHVTERAAVVASRPAHSGDFMRTVYGRVPHNTSPAARGITVTSQPPVVPHQYVCHGGLSVQDPVQTLTIREQGQPITMAANTYPRIVIKHLTLVNGKDVKDFSDAEIAETFTALDQAIKDIETMERPLPKRLTNRLEKLKADRKQLVEVLDALEPDADKPAAE